MGRVPSVGEGLLEVVAAAEARSTIWSQGWASPPKKRERDQESPGFQSDGMLTTSGSVRRPEMACSAASLSSRWRTSSAA